MVLSLSPGPSQLEYAAHLQAHANQWRVCNDFWDTWPQLRDNLVNLVKWAPHARPGAWPDADMLPVGKIGLRNHDGEPPRRGERDTRAPRLLGARRPARRHPHANHPPAWRTARALRLKTRRPR
jgi:hypothetical protein